MVDILQFAVGDRVQAEFPSVVTAESIDYAVSFPTADCNREAVVTGHYIWNGPERILYVVRLSNGVSWTCRAKWLTPEGGPW